MSSRQSFEADGLQTEFTFTFPYLDQSHVKVYVNGRLQIYALGYLLQGQKVVFGSAPKLGDTVEIHRQTSPLNPIVDFQDGSVLREKDLDTAYLHNFYLSQENRDHFQKLINDALLSFAERADLEETEPDAIYAELVGKLLEDDLLAQFQQRIADIDLNAESIVQIGEGLQTQINTLAEGTAALVFVQPEEPIPGVDGIPSPIPDGARWYDEDDNNKPHVYDEANSVWVSIVDPRIGQNQNAITQLGVDLTTLDESATATSDALQVLDTTVTDIDGRLTSTAADVTSLETNLASTDGTVAAQGTALDGLTTRVTQAEGEISSTSSSVTVLTNRIDTAEGSISAQSTAISGLESDVSRIDGDISSQASDITSLQAGLSDTIADVDANGTALGGLTTRVTANEDEVTSLSSDITTLTNRVGTVESDLSGQSTAIGGLSSRVTLVENDITSQASDISSLQSSISNTNTNVSANATAISGIETNVSSIEGDVSSISTSLTSLSNSLSNTNDDVAANSTALAALDSRVTDSEGDITSISSSITSLQTSLSNTNSSITANADAISGIDTRVTSTEDSITSQSSSITNLQASVTTIEGDIDSANVQITAAANAAANAQSDADTAAADAATANNGVTALEAMYGVRLNVNGYVTGFIQNNDGQSGNFVLLADKFAVVDPSGDAGETEYVPFEINNGKINLRGDVKVDGNLLINGSLGGTKIADNAIDADHIKAGSIVARHLSIQSDTGKTRTVFNPESDNPILITDSVTGEGVFEVKLEDGAPRATVNGNAGAGFVSNAAAITEEVKRAINPYYLGPSGTGSAASASLTSGGTRNFSISTNAQGKVEISFKLSKSHSQSGTQQFYAAPDWTVRVRRNSASGSIIYSKRYVGNVWSIAEGFEQGTPVYWDNGYSITIDDGFVDEAAPANGTEVYYLEVIRNGGTPTSITCSKFEGSSAGFTVSEASKSTNGYWKCKDTGVIMQWGTMSIGANSSSSASFPITFPSACRSVVLTERVSFTESTKEVTLTSRTASSFTARNNVDQSVWVDWMAIGY